MKKFIYFFVIFFLVLESFYYFLFIRPATPFSKDYCAFCDKGVLERQKFYEDDTVLALYTYKPVLPGHVLVLPKRHVERFENLTDKEMQQIYRVIKKVNLAVQKAFQTSSYLLLQKNGQEAMQTVPHVHFHYMPKKKRDDSTFKFLWKFLIACAKQPVSQAEIDQNIEKIKAEIN